MNEFEVCSGVGFKMHGDAPGVVRVEINLPITVGAYEYLQLVLRLYHRVKTTPYSLRHILLWVENRELHSTLVQVPAFYTSAAQNTTYRLRESNFPFTEIKNVHAPVSDLQDLGPPRNTVVSPGRQPVSAPIIVSSILSCCSKPDFSSSMGLATHGSDASLSPRGWNPCDGVTGKNAS